MEGNQEVAEALPRHEREHHDQRNCVDSLVCNSADPGVEVEGGFGSSRLKSFDDIIAYVVKLVVVDVVGNQDETEHCCKSECCLG